MLTSKQKPKVYLIKGQRYKKSA